MDNASLILLDLAEAFSSACIPDIQELRDAFAKAIPKVLDLARSASPGG